MTIHTAKGSGAGIEALLADFKPDFDFVAPPPLPEAEFVERLRRIRREAVVAGHDVLLIHTDMVGWFHTSNAYLRYVCDWMREGVLIVPTDVDKELTLLSFFTQSVILPPGGEPMLVGDIWQIGAIGREYADRPGSSVVKTAEACAKLLGQMGFANAQIGRLGDRTSTTLWGLLDGLMPKAKFVADNGIIDRMQRVRSPREVELFRAAAQLISIGTQAAYHVTRPGVTDAEIYAAFTFAQLARGGETGDGYQIGINEFGTHCGKPYGHVVRPGDLINLYISNVTYRGYTAQTARMIGVGTLTDRQEEVLATCTEGVKRAEKLIGPGALMRDINNAAFEPFIERGLLDSPEARNMPYNWSSLPDGEPRLLPRQYVPDADWEAQGRTLMHVYPATHGPHNPNLGHSVGMAGAQNSFNISSHNYDTLEEGMIFVLHTQWLEPLSAGCNVGDCYLVTADGFENLSRHTPLETFRVLSETELTGEAAHAHFDFAALTARERYKLLIGTVIPRPIALITTLSKDGQPNAGPFSFFNVLTHDPAIVAIGVENYSDMAFKDTARNIRETGEFTVHIVDNALVEQMEICAIKFGPEVNELAEAGLETVAGKMVRSPRILAAPAALECRRHTTLQVGPAREIILGEVLGVFVRSDAVDRSNLHIDQQLMDVVGRLGGHTYSRTRDQFDIKTKTKEEWAMRGV